MKVSGEVSDQVVGFVACCCRCQKTVVFRQAAPARSRMVVGDMSVGSTPDWWSVGKGGLVQLTWGRPNLKGHNDRKRCLTCVRHYTIFSRYPFTSNASISSPRRSLSIKCASTLTIVPRETERRECLLSIWTIADKFLCSVGVKLKIFPLRDKVLMKQVGVRILKFPAFFADIVNLTPSITVPITVPKNGRILLANCRGCWSTHEKQNVCGSCNINNQTITDFANSIWPYDGTLKIAGLVT